MRNEFSAHAILRLRSQPPPPTPVRFGFIPFPSHSLTQSKKLRKSSFSLKLYNNSPKRRVFGRSSSVIRSSVAKEANGAAEHKPKQQPAVKRPYPFHEIELKWQRYWEENRTFRTPEEIDTSKPKYYVLDMFPYPSGAGLHVGHPLGYTATYILARLKRMQGYTVLHPMGWDAFGLPAEQYAIETGTHPKITTLKNIDRFRSQPMKQWMLKITAYADRLLEDLDDLDWPESIKEMQRNWIGRSEGAEMEFPILSSDGQERDTKITIYTTRPDTIFGATYLVVAPEHPLLSVVVSTTQRETVEEYIDIASRKSDLERTDLQKEKTGVFSGCYTKNPVHGEAIPIWVADYVLGRYYLRFMDLKNSEKLVAKTKEIYWNQVDVYVGGAEHAVLHLLYSRFWHKVLYDIGAMSTKEPFNCVINQGIILGEFQYITYMFLMGILSLRALEQQSNISKK